MAAALHPPDATLAAFGLGRLDESATDEVARHLESCPDCQRRVADVPIDEFLGRLRDAAAAQADTSRPNESVADAPAGSPPAGLPPELADATQYADIRELGRGGMGVVYLARNTIMDRLEVLKVVTRSADRFVREIQAAARLKHPNVVGAYSAQRYGGTLVFAMEYVPGEDLAQLVKARGPLPVPHACNYAYQAALGLQHAHENGMIHRDIKPSNLILTRDGNKPAVKILDFGLAKGTSESKLDTSQTAEGAMLGTPDYIAPEQTLDAARADIRSDLYSLGCTLYHLLAGRPPFVGRSLYEVLRAHHSAEAVRLSLVRPEVPDELAGVVAKMMAKDPARRYPSPTAVAAALTPFFKPGARVTSTSLSVAPPAGRAPALGRLEPAPKRPASPPPLPSAPPAASPVERPRRARRQFVWAIGLLAAALLVIGTVGLLVKTRNGTIVLEGLPPDADVLVDGEQVTVKRNGDEATVTVARGGPYGLKIKLGDRELRTSDATVTIGGDPVRIKVQDYEPTSEPAPIPPAGNPGPPAVPRTEKKAPVPDRTAWTNGAGQWRVEGGEIIQSDAATDNCVLVFGDPEWTDYDYSFDVVKTSGAFGAGAVFRASDPRNYMLFDLAGYQNRKYTIEVRADGEFHHWVNNDRLGSMARDRTYHVKVWARGDHFVCSIDGEVIYDVRDSYFARGAVGLRCWGGAVRVGSILIKSPDGTVLWEGPPELPTPADPKARRPLDVSGRWRVDGDELVQEAGDGYTKLSFGDVNWSDYDFTCDVKRTGGAHEVQLKYRVSPSGEETFGLGGWADTQDFATSWARGKAALQRKKPTAGVGSDRWYTMRVRVRGKRCECFRDGQLLFQYDDPKNTKGAPGVGTFKTAARFRNIRVSDAGGKTLWTGLPNLSGVVQAPAAPSIDPKVRASFTNRGDWSIDGDEIVQSNDRDGDCEIVFGDPAWTDYNFVCQCKVVSGYGEIGQTVRVTEAGRYEWVLGRWNGHNYSLGSVARGEILERVWWAPLDRTDRDKKLDLDRWYTLEVRVRGSKVECLVDGASIVKVDHERYKGGRVGLRTFKTQARYRNLKVTDPAGKVLFEGLPELPAKAVNWIPDS